MPDDDTAKKVSIEYTLAAAKAFTPTSAPEKKFRFIYLSGAASERDQTKPLWFMQEYRRTRVRLIISLDLKCRDSQYAN